LSLEHLSSKVVNSMSLSSVTEKTEYTIGALAKACDLTVRTLRYYEEMDLIQAIGRTSGGYRLYDDTTKKRIEAILSLQALNYSLDDILGILGTASSTNDALPKASRVRATKDILQRQQDALDEKLSSLLELQKDVKKRLAVLEQTCAPCVDHSPNDASACSDCEHGSVHWH
jgi:MerR family transcriptional regulator, copper efflux regulator